MKYLPIILTLGLLTGCSSLTSFKSLPKSDSEYLLKKTKLSEKYPEIPANELHWRGLSPQFPTEESLVKEMGEPQEIKRDWLYPIVVVATGIAVHAQPIVYAIMFAIRPDTPKTYFYKKGNYCVETHMDKNIMSSYTSHMSWWDWKENTVPCN